jgi:carbon storage regulator
MCSIGYTFGSKMLYITRKIGEEIVINNDIFVIIKEVSKNKVKIGFRFPDQATILRKELYDKISIENMMAKDSAKQEDLPEIKSIATKFDINNSCKGS